MKKVHKRIVTIVLAVALLAGGFAGGWFMSQYHYRQWWTGNAQAIREGGTREYVDGGAIVPKQTPTP